MPAEYELVTVNTRTGNTWARDLLQGWEHGEPVGAIVHRAGNPIADDGSRRGANGLQQMRYAVSSRAFSIHYFVDGRVVYAGVPESKHAFHVRASREAANRGRTVYRSRRMAVTPQWLTARANGEFAGASKPRGDIGMIGIEHVDRINTAGGRPYIDAETRRTGVFLLRDIVRRRAEARDQDIRQVYFPISDHSIWDLENRPDDLGVTWYLPDLRLDVWDALCGREPWRTTGDGYDGSQPAEARNPLDVTDRMDESRVDVMTMREHAESIVRIGEAVEARLRPRG